MKKLLLIFGTIIIVGLVWFIMPGSQPNLTDSSSYFSKYSQYRLKNRKMPRKERRPNEWYYTQRAYPNASIPAGRQQAAIEAAKEMQLAQQGEKAIGYETWLNAGPTNIPGRITDIAAHPSNPDVVYAASAAGGIFRSDYVGDDWDPVFDEAGVQSMGAIAIHPDNPSIIYAGTGEPNNAGDSYEGTGVYKTSNGGLSWTNMGLPNSFHIGRIVIEPFWPETLYVAVMGKLFGTNPERGVYRSVDGGNTWEQKLFVSDSTGCIDIAINGTGVVIACMLERVRDPARRVVGGITSGVWRSFDFGDTWEDITGEHANDPGYPNGLPYHSTDMGRIGISMPALSSMAYLLFADASGAYTGIYRTFASDNPGDPWPWSTYDEYNELSELNGSWNGGWYFGNIRAVPYSDAVYALGLDLYYKQDQYSAWENVRNGQHVDMHAMWIDPGNATNIYCGNDGGVYHTTNSGYNWTSLDKMPNTQFYAIEINPRFSYDLYGGTQDNGTMQGYSMNFDDWRGILGGDGFYVIVDYFDTDIIYAEYQNGYLMKSTDGGDSWAYGMNGIDYENDRHNWSTPIAMDAVNHMILYYGSHILYKTTDGAENWTAISGDLTKGTHPGNLGLGTISTIDVSRANPEVIYVGTDDGNVQVTTNGGGNWNLRTSGLPNRWVTRVTCDPFSENIAYVTLSGYKDGLSDAHIYRTTDYGVSWSPIDGDLPDVPVNDILVDLHNSAILYIGTDVGVYYSENLGSNWTLMNDGIPIVPVMDIDFNVLPRALVAGTHGRSMYRTIVDCPSLTDGDSDGTPDECDNCPGINNQQHADADYDFIGDDCDDCTDTDGDGYGDAGYPANTCPEDNCPSVYNPSQIDTDGDGVGDACLTRWTTYDTLATSCLKLIVGNNGNSGRAGTAGYSMDYSNSGDCDPNAFPYLYDGSPLINYHNGSEQVNYYSMYFNDPFLLVTDLDSTIPTQTTAEYDIYETGTFCTPDGAIAMEKTWWAPKNVDSCNFMIQRLRVFSYDGLSHSGVAISEAFDWDIPNDDPTYPTNSGGYDAIHRLVYTRGTDTDVVGCQPNNTRYGGTAMIGSYINDPMTIDTLTGPYSAYLLDNETYLFPSTGWDPVVTDGVIQNPGYGILADSADLNTIMTYFYNYTINPAETLYVYTVITTVQNGSAPSADKGADDLIANIQMAKQWTNDHVIPLSSAEYVCGDANGDGSCNLGDAGFIINYIFYSGPPPSPTDAGDANADGGVNLGDAGYIINYIFYSGPVPVCP